MTPTDDELRTLLDPQHTVLIVVDKQRGYIDRIDNQSTGILKAKVDEIDDFILLARTNHVPVLWTKMIENIKDAPDNLRFIMEHDASHIDVIKQNEESFNICGNAIPTSSETVIVKKRHNAFADTGLAQTLKAQSVKTVILVGGYASRCVLATAIGAADNGFYVVVPKQLIGNPDPFKDEVPVALQIIQAVHGTVLDSAVIEKAWQTIVSTRQ